MIIFKEKILIVDLSNMVYFCKPPWLEQKLIDGGYDMVDQFMVIFNTYLRTISPTKVFIAIDGYPKWRYDIYPEYKGTRNREQTALSMAFYRNKNAIKKLLEYLPVGAIYHKDLEADDVAYIICKYYEDKDVDVVALSTDKDWLQLMNQFENVSVYNQLKKTFVEKPKEDIARVKCLTGDSSDNINGFHRIGEVTAKKILKNKETFFNWYNSLNDEGKNLYKRNLKLMLLKKIPQEYIEEVLTKLDSMEFKEKVDWDGIRDFYDSLSLNKEKLAKYKPNIDDLCRT